LMLFLGICSSTTIVLQQQQQQQQQTLGIQSYSQLMIGLSNHLLSKVLGFHYHSQKVIGSLGNNNKFYRFYIGGEGNQES